MGRITIANVGKSTLRCVTTVDGKKGNERGHEKRGKYLAVSVPYEKNGLRKLFYVEQIVVFLAFLDKDAAA